MLNKDRNLQLFQILSMITFTPTLAPNCIIDKTIIVPQDGVVIFADVCLQMENNMLSIEMTTMNSVTYFKPLVPQFILFGRPSSLKYIGKCSRK